MGILKKGLLQVYTGPGKGKTTAALGLAWRMLGWGGSVYVCQFLKPVDRATGEATLAERLSVAPGKLTFERLNEPWDMAAGMDDAEQVERMRAAIARKLAEIRQPARDGDYDLMILDEIVFALHLGLALPADMHAIIDERAGELELVLTGRGAHEDLVARADLVTRMEEVKHAYEQGIQARQGVEF